MRSPTPVPDQPAPGASRAPSPAVLPPAPPAASRPVGGASAPAAVPPAQAAAPSVGFRDRLALAALQFPPRLLDVLFLCVLALYVQGYVSHYSVFQGDLRSYITAARAALAGLDPYDPVTLDALAKRHIYPFVYPPVTLLVFVPLTWLPVKLAMAGYMWAKVAALAGLVFVWRRRYLPGSSLVALSLLTLYGANRSAQWDLSTGNVATLEAVLLYSAFAFWAAGRRTVFAALVVAASLFKLAPAVFLLLLLVPLEHAPARPRLLAGALAALAALVFLPMLAGPAHGWTAFFAHVPDATTYTDANPSSLGFFTVAAARAGLPASAAVGKGLWLAYVAGLLWLSRAHLRATFAQRDAARVVMSAVLLDVIVHPRVMAYGFVLATPALLYFMPRPFTGRVGQLQFALVLCAQGLLQQLTSVYSGSVFVLYAPFILSLCVWLLAVTAPQAEPARALATEPALAA